MKLGRLNLIGVATPSIAFCRSATRATPRDITPL
jgi:hypothetical protein